MATILLQAAGGALGGLVGGPFGAVAGRALGALGGAALDNRLFGAGTRRTAGPRLQARALDADEGGGVPRVFGTARVTGRIVWATRFEKVATTERQGGKGGGGAGAAEHTSYSYFGSFAVALCEGPIAGVRRIWADGEEIDRSSVDLHLHLGTETQEPDPLIEAKQGRGNAPAYRGTAYLVFARLALERWGNRLPQISAEVLRPVGTLERELRAVCVIPGASEHGLDPVVVRERVGAGEDRLLNRHVLHGSSDWTASLDELQALCPKLERAALIVGWFADDLRAGTAEVRPRVETARREETEPWRAGGLERGAAPVVSQVDGGPAYGGTPSDAGAVRAIRDLRARGLRVTLYPFLFMDVPPGNARADPYGGAEQAPFPWRGRMTLDRAPGTSGSADGTARARAEIERFCGRARAADFRAEGGEVRYGGPAEWSLRRMVLHQAALAALAGGVDAFVIASEMRGLTCLRDAEGRFPFVDALVALAREVRLLLPEAKITYAADWSEYFGTRPADGSGDVFFNLDPLWADPAIDMVGIDNYLPLADLSGTEGDGEEADGFASPYDREALRRGARSGEHFDWFYASDADRAAGRRTPIRDGAHGKPWVFRAKDLAGWWGNRHVERRGGREVGAPTAWTPGMKPIWFTELGCPAVDGGANQPNVFLDPKSAESALPHRSGGGRDDAAQRSFLEAHLQRWDPAGPDFREGDNPVSPVYGGRMVDPAAIHLWCWDARPAPAFPERADVWRDGGNWDRGHWLTGRLGRAPLGPLLAEVLAGHGIPDADLGEVDGEVGGLVLGEPASARAEIEDLLRLCDLEGRSQGGRLRFRSNARRLPVRRVAALVDEDDEPIVELRRGEAGDLPGEVVLGFSDPRRAYQPAVAEAVSPLRPAARQASLELPVVLGEAEARRLAQGALAKAWRERDTARFALPPEEIDVVVGDVLALPATEGLWQVERIEDGATRKVTARRRGAPRTGGSERGGDGASPAAPAPTFASRPVVHLLDLPRLAAHPDGTTARVAVSARPWRPYALLSSPADEGFAPRLAVGRAACVGTLAAPLRAGPEGRIDRGNRIVVEFVSGRLASIGETAWLAGGNLAAVRGAAGWEVVGFRDVEETAPGRFTLRHLLRGIGGSEDAGEAEAGAAFVLLDEATPPLTLTAAEIAAPLRWLCVPAGAGLDDPAAVRLTATLGGRAPRPLSPVHPRARLDAAGLRLSWIRRTRSPDEGWDGEVALGEERESYEVALRAGGGTLRRVVDEPTLVLPAADLAAGFGAVPERLDVEIAQLSHTAGRGTARRIEVRRR